MINLHTFTNLHFNLHEDATFTPSPLIYKGEGSDSVVKAEQLMQGWFDGECIAGERLAHLITNPCQCCICRDTL